MFIVASLKFGTRRSLGTKTNFSILVGFSRNSKFENNFNSLASFNDQRDIKKKTTTKTAQLYIIFCQTLE